MKIEQDIARYIQDGVEKDYSFRMRDETAIGLARLIINRMNRDLEKETTNDTPVFSVLEKYYRTTTIPEGQFKRHSAYAFSLFLSKNYFTILINKNIISYVKAFIKKIFEAKKNSKGLREEKKQESSQAIIFDRSTEGFAQRKGFSSRY